MRIHRPRAQAEQPGRRPRRERLSVHLLLLVLRPVVSLLRRQAIGLEHVPASGGVLIVANHLSVLDPLLLGVMLHDGGRTPRFLATSGLFEVPVLGRALRGAGQIPVHRGSVRAVDAYRDAVDAIGRGECVVVYPEGSITRQPAFWPGPGKTGAARIALATGAPVVPLGQWGLQAVLPVGHAVPRLFPRPTVAIRIGPPLHLDDLREQPVTADTLRMATARVMSAIVALVAALRGEPAPSQFGANPVTAQDPNND